MRAFGPAPPAKALTFIYGVYMQTNQELLTELLKATQAKEHRQFQLLQNTKDYFIAKRARRGHVLLLSSIKVSANKLLKTYCKSIVLGESDLTKLLAYRTLLDIKAFYQEELQILEDMLYEYECYLADGNWLDFILGQDRSADKLVDHRGLYK
jgi:hypothetical protein